MLCEKVSAFGLSIYSSKLIYNKMFDLLHEAIGSRRIGGSLVSHASLIADGMTLKHQIIVKLVCAI